MTPKDTIVNSRKVKAVKETLMSKSRYEYDRIYQLRDSWSQIILTWDKIFIPIGAGIVALFVVQLPTFADRRWAYPFLIIGWLLFCVCMIFWRWRIQDLDRQIAAMYPRMIELERVLHIEAIVTHFFGNLTRQSKKHLAEELKKDLSCFKHADFRCLKKMASGDPYINLLSVWDRFQHNSVTGRGHQYTDIVVAFFILAFILAILVGGVCGWFAPGA